MTSATDITRRRRTAKKAKAGQLRKNKVRKTGTTPEIFALNRPVEGSK